jgi:hypothetical protein
MNNSNWHNAFNKNNPVNFNKNNPIDFNNNNNPVDFNKLNQIDLNKLNQIDQKLNQIDFNKLNQIDQKLNQIKNDLDIMKYKESTKHIIHQGIVCNNCKKVNMIGMRYKCFHCPEYNICEDCEKYLSFYHDNSHFFIRIHDSSLYNNIINNQVKK